MEVERPAMATTRRRVAPGLWCLAAAAFAAGLAIANWSTLGDRTMRFLAFLGQPRLEAMQAMEEPVIGPDGIPRTEWLVFFEDDVTQAQRARLLESHESVHFVERTIFSSGVVVSVPDAARTVVEAIRASPAVWLMLKDRPFYLCH